MLMLATALTTPGVTWTATSLNRAGVTTLTSTRGTAWTRAVDWAAAASPCGCWTSSRRRSRPSSLPRQIRPTSRSCHQMCRISWSSYRRHLRRSSCLSRTLYYRPLRRSSRASRATTSSPWRGQRTERSSLSENIVLCGFLVVHVAIPAPRPSSQAADLRRNARERPPPLGAPEGCSATVRLRSVGGVKVGCTHPVCLAEWWSPWRHGCRTPGAARSITPSVSNGV